MYSVSADYLTAIAKNARAHKLKGVVGLNHNFDGDDVIKGSFQIRNQFCQSTAIELGGVYIGELDLTFSTEFAQAMNIRGSWLGVKITPQIGVELADETFEYIPMGIYTVSEANWTTGGLQITAYDNMSKFDRSFANTQSSGTLYDFLEFACLRCGVTLGMSSAQCAALPNGTEQLGLYPDESIETYRDMISQLASMACCFATIDRTGELVLRRLPDTTVTATVPHTARYSTTFSDYTSYYDTITVVNMKDDTLSAYRNDNIDGLTMNLGSNPFLQYGADEIVTRMRQAVADGIEDFEATPFSVSILPNPALDLGDVIQFTGGVGNGSIGCIMSFTHRVDSTVIEGYGENPALADARSKFDKDLSGLIGKTAEQELIIYTFENVQQFELADETEEDVIEIHFATVSPKVVQILHELKLDVEAVDPTEPITCTVHYYLNDEELSYHPVTSWDNDGYHLLHLMYFLSTLEDGQRYDWRVALEMGNATAEIDRGDIRAMLFGQGLVATDEWAGLVPIKDPTYYLVLGGELRYNYEEGTVETQDYLEPTDPDWDGTHTLVRLPTITDDSYVLTLGGELTYNYEEGRVDADTFDVPTGIITENGDALASEGDEWFITE